MPAMATRSSTLSAGGIGFKQIEAVKSDKTGEICRSNGDFTPRKRKLRSDSMSSQESLTASPIVLKSPRRCISFAPRVLAPGIEEDSSEELTVSCKSLVDRSANCCSTKTQWNPRDMEHINTVSEALHVSTAPSTVVCREDEQRRILQFCMACIEHNKAGSLYACGCPGTGKSLSMEKVKKQLAEWVEEEGFELPDVLTLNCTSLTRTSEIFSKMLTKNQSQKKLNGSAPPLQLLQNFYSQKSQSSGMKMMLIIADELDYLITRDRAVLHDLFMLTTLPFSKCILIGIANAIDLADRFLPRLQSLNCKPMVVTFRAYSKDQILMILKERLMALPYTVFQPQALELCARKVAAASGDMRKALCVCRSAIEVLEVELKESMDNQYSSFGEKGTEEINTVRIDHMVRALSKTYASPTVNTIQSLPQHQQIILCSVVKSFRGSKKDTTIGELNKSYLEICKSTLIPPAGILEFSSMCRVLNDQGLVKLGQAREDKLKRVTLKIDEADVTFALQGVRFFRNCLL